MNIYIASALTHVPRQQFSEYAKFLHQLADGLKMLERIDVVRYALIDSDPQLATKPSEDRALLCYAWDKKMVEEADLIIAECSFPSIGLGIELQIAESHSTPIIIVYGDYYEKTKPVTYINPDNTKHELQIGEGYVSLMALGVPSVKKVLKYKNPTQGVVNILNAVKLLNVN